MNSKIVFALVALFSATAWAVEKTAYTLTRTTNATVIIRFTNNFPIPNGVSTLEGLTNRRWAVLQNFFTTQNIGSVELPLPTGYTNYRLRSMSVIPGNAFPRLALAYGNITTVAGTGPVPAGTNLWRPEYEGAIATNVPLSSPRSAVADEAGNIYVVEPSTHSVLVIARTNGRIYTAIGQLGQRTNGNIILPSGDPSFPAVTPPPSDDPYSFSFAVLNRPTGLYYSRGILYVLDSGNARIVKYRDGQVSKLFVAAGIGTAASFENGGSLWVSGDEQEAFFTDGTLLKHWKAKDLQNGAGGVSIEAAGLANLSDVKVDPRGRTIVADEGANRLYRVRGPDRDFRQDIQAGTGQTVGRYVGDARKAAIFGPSSIAYLPIGGYFISTDAGARVWYVDIDGSIAPFIFGRAPTAKKAGAHAGDGQWFRRGGRIPKVSNVESISVAPNGDLILLEGGYVRKIQFLRARP